MPALPGTAVPPAADASGIARATAHLVLRATPGVDSAAVPTVPSGSTVPLSGEASGDFLGVSYPDAAGWADAAYLTAP